MPTFDYQCSACNVVQEEFHSISATPEIKCTVCGAMCKKLFTACDNVIFKGGGWTTSDSKFKKSMLEKNAKMTNKMTERVASGDAVNNIGDLKKKKGI